MILMIYMAVMASLSGGTFPFSQYLNKKGAVNEEGNDKGGKLPFNGSFIPELLFAIPFGVCASIYFSNYIYVCAAIVLGTAWSYVWMQTGHGVVLPWGDKYPQNGRKQFLTSFVNFLAGICNIKIYNAENDSEGYTIQYCRLFMAVKGFLIGIPAFPAAFILAILWPLSYEIGRKLRDHSFLINGKPFDTHMVTELLSGIGAAIAILMVLNGVSYDVLN